MFDWIHAERGFGPLLFYLAIVVVWTVLKKISNIAQRRKNAAEPTARPRPPQQRTERRRDVQIDPALQEFLESLTGQKLDLEPEPPPKQPLPLPIPKRETATRPSLPVLAAPEPRTQSAPGRRVRQTRSIELPELDLDAYLLKGEVGDVISQTEIGEHVHRPSRQVLGNLSALAGLEALRIPMPSLKLPEMRSATHGNYRVKLKGHNAIERAIVDRVILGPPKAMGIESEAWGAIL